MGEPAVAARSSVEHLVELLDESYDDPPFFFENVLKVKPRRWQDLVLCAIRDRRQAGEMHTKVHVRAAHFSGKGWLAAGCVLWWQATRPNARTLTTAPTWKGVEDYLWTEIRQLYTRSFLFAPVRVGRMLNTEWKCGGDDDKYAHWFASGASSDHPENMEGQHSPTAACRVVDEAKAVGDGVFTATEGLLAAPESFDFWISTPGSRVGKFYSRDLKAGPELIRKVVTIEDLIADGVEGATEWKADAIKEFGSEENFEYLSRAMAQYVDDAEGALFPFSWIERAMYDDLERSARGLPVWHISGKPTLGFDVAGSVDGDENATAPARGPDAGRRYEVGPLTHWHQHDTMVSKDRVIAQAKDTKARCIRADVQGLGKGVIDALRREIRESVNPKLQFWVEDYRSADQAEDPERFLNKKAENAWSVRMMLEQDRVRLPNDPKLREQMAAMKYEVRNGKIRVVDPKDSPDLWDAVLMAIGGVYHSLSADSIGGGGVNTWGADPKHLGWTERA